MPNELGQPNIVEILTQRVDILQRKIVELQEQTRHSQNQINHYSALLRQYRAVIEAESLGLEYEPPPEEIMAEPFDDVKLRTPRRNHKLSVAKAVREIMGNRKGEILSQSRVYELIEQTYPDLRARRSDNIMSAVAHSLIRGVYMKQWKRIRPGVYQA